MFGKRRATFQGGRQFSAPELAQRIIKSMHPLEVWSKLKELEFYVHLSPHQDLSRNERDALRDCLECKFTTGSFDTLQRDFQAKLITLERTLGGRYENVVIFLRPTGAPSKAEVTNYALRYLEPSNVDCLKDLLIRRVARRAHELADSIIDLVKREASLSFEDTQSVTLDIQEFVTYLYPWQRQLLHLHLLTSRHKPHPAEVNWVQDALMNPRIAKLVERVRVNNSPANPSPAAKELDTIISYVVDESTYRQPGAMAAMLRTEAAELDKQEMDALIDQIRDAQDFLGPGDIQREAVVVHKGILSYDN